MKNQISIKNLAIAIVAVVGCVGTFLPWLSTAVLGISMTANGTAGDGWLSFALFIAVLVLALINIKKEPAMWVKICIDILSVLAFLVVIFKIPNAVSNGFTIGAGIYVVLITSVIVAIMPWVPIKQK